jgi:hypothetical protein
VTTRIMSSAKIEDLFQFASDRAEVRYYRRLDGPFFQT